MAKASFVQSLSPLSIGLGLAATGFLLGAAALTKATLNECRAERAFRKALTGWGSSREDLAAQSLPEALEAKPRRYPSPRLLEAMLKARAGDLAGARKDYEALLAEEKPALPARERALCLNGVGVLAVQAGRPPDGKPWGGAPLTEARDRFRQALELWPELPEPTLNLAALEFLEGRFDGAKVHLAKAAEVGRLPPSADGARLDALLRLKLAERAGDWDRALLQARRFQAYRPLGAAEQLLEIRTLGRQALAAGLPERPLPRALPWEGEIDRVPPQAVDTLLALQARVALGTWHMESYEKARRKVPDLSGDEDRQFRDLINRHLSAAGVHPSATWLWAVQVSRDLARIRLGPEAAGSAAGALPALSAAAQLHGIPDARRAVLLNNLGSALSVSGKPEEALKALEQAAQLAASDPLVAANLAVALDLKGDRIAALKWYARSLSLRPGQPQLQARAEALRRAPP